MKPNRQLSDIEELLAGQLWKTKKLPPISHTPKHFSKIRSVTEIEKPRKTERIITHPCHIIPEQNNEEPKSETKKLFSKTSLLAIPFGAVNKMISGITNREIISNIEVPMFPKTPFGSTTLSLTIVPKFEKVSVGVDNEIIKGMKLESGRIKKRVPYTKHEKFEYLKDLKQVTGTTSTKFLRFPTSHFEF